MCKAGVVACVSHDDDDDDDDDEQEAARSADAPTKTPLDEDTAPKSVTDHPNLLRISPRSFTPRSPTKGFWGRFREKLRRGANFFRRPFAPTKNFQTKTSYRGYRGVNNKYGSSRIQGTSARKGIFENLRRRNAEDGYFPTARLRGNSRVRSESQESRRFFC